MLTSHFLDKDQNNTKIGKKLKLKSSRKSTKGLSYPGKNTANVCNS
jgi:hypothetical protein